MSVLSVSPRGLLHDLPDHSLDFHPLLDSGGRLTHVEVAAGEVAEVAVAVVATL